MNRELEIKNGWEIYLEMLKEEQEQKPKQKEDDDGRKMHEL